MKVLIIEDEEKLVHHLKKALEEEGISVEYCLNGRSGQNFIELNHSSIDLIILDLLLPDIDGINLCKGIRYQNISTPILILSAKSTISDKIAGLDAGADDYVSKPFSIKELLSRIRALTRRPSVMLNPEIKIDNLVLDSINKKVTMDNRDVKLTTKEFRLLEYLIKHPNQVISRENILDQLWDLSFDSLSNVIDVHIKNLRKKIGDNDHDKRIETVRGMGYRLNK